MSSDDIVITGMGCRLAESSNTDQFWKNLFDGINMCVDRDDKWPEGTYNIANKMGRIPDWNDFDGQFFGLDSVAESLDAVSKIILETSYESIIDAGISPQSIRNSETGVYVGSTHYPMTEGIAEEVQTDCITQKGLMAQMIVGNIKALLANRISFMFDFKGPSLTTDTACSSSFSALYLAVNDLLAGNCDRAIVGGVQMTLEPFLVQMKQTSALCSPRGVSAVLDESADGFVKSDGVACLVLQRRSEAKRVYATVRAVRMNDDGYKTVGQFFPSSEAQEKLMIDTYKKAQIDPLKVTYIEGHLTGTRVGDPQEVKAIYNAYCKHPERKQPLPLGCLKGNMGHAEGCSGMASVIKVCLAFENECLPANINLKQLKEELKEFCPPLYPNTQLIAYKPGLAAINNFGVGGVNVHLLVEPNYKLSSDDDFRIAEEIPRIVNICGRTEEAVRHVFSFIENNPDKVTKDFLALLSQVMKYKPNITFGSFPFRGSMIIKKMSEDKSGIKYEYKKQITETKAKIVRPLWFLFPGLGGQWTAMAKALMPIEIFRNKVEECHQILEEYGIDLKYLLLSDDKIAMSTMTAKFCATTAIEIALFEVLKALDITPDGIIGHSFGEVAAAYADGCLTTKQAMVTTYLRGAITENDKTIPIGIMAVCGISKNEARKYVQGDVVIACNNAKNTVVLSGPEGQMKQLMSELKSKNVFVVQLESSGIPYHHPVLKTSAKPMADAIKNILTEPKMRSKKWISTSIAEEEPKEDILNYASAEYFVNNLVSPVYFYEKFKCLPMDAIVVEIGPHGVFRKIVTETLESASYHTLIRKDSNDTNLDNFLSAIASLYELGINPSIENLYPKVDFPVARKTVSIGSLMKWDHSVKYRARKYPDHYNRSTAADMNIVVDINTRDDSYYSGHCIDGNILFPATGYLMLAYRMYASTLSKEWIDVPVVFEQVQFKQAIFLNETTPTYLKVVYSRKSGDFTILENDNECVRGKVCAPVEDSLVMQSVFYDNNNRVFENEFILTKDDIYKDFRTRGYDYSNEFQKLSKIRTSDFVTALGECEWNGNIVSFLDCLLQAQMVCSPFKKLMVPVMVKRMRIDPKVLTDSVRHNKVAESDTSELVNDMPDQLKMIDTRDAFESYKTKFCHYHSKIPFYFNANTNTLIAPGIEIENVVVFPIPRKMPTTLNLDSYELIANEDNNAINQCDKQYINTYLELCKSRLARLKQQGLNHLKCDFNYKQFPTEEMDRQRHDNNDSKVILNILDKFSEMVDNENALTLNSVQSVVDDNKFHITRDIVNQVSKNERLIRTLVDIVSENNATKKDYKVVELNLTADILAKEVDTYLTTSQIHPTNVELKLFYRSSDNLAIKGLKDCVTEWDGQDIPELPTSDLVIYRDSPQLWHLNIDNLVIKLKESVADKGFLILVIKYRLTEPEEALNSLTNGKNITNQDMKKRVVCLSDKISDSGLLLVANKSDSISTLTMLFRKVTEKMKPPTNAIIEVTADRDEEWFEAIRDSLLKCKDAIDSGNEGQNVWLLSRDTDINGIIGLINCLRLEPGGQCLRCIFDMDCKLLLPIDWQSKPYSDILTNDLVVNVIKDGRLGTYRHIKLTKDDDKVLSRDYFLNVGATKDLSNLNWFDKKNLFSNYSPNDWFGRPVKIVPVNIYTSGLIFKDIMLATGRIPSGIMGLFTDCMIGIEFAGRRADTGERVMGFSNCRAIASSIDSYDNWITPIPDHWSMDEAVTILSTYSTLWYGLIKRGGLARGESILIHSGAGGIGQSAINICKHYDCDIYVTVGNEEKKQFIVKEFGISEHKIFSSRDIQFKYKILEMTAGKGVDLVVNSLTGEKLEASYELLAKGGRFIEIGKYDMVNNKQLSMFDFLKDTSFVAISVDVALFERPEFAKQFFDWMHNNSSNGCVKPYNQIVFEAKDADKAFRYMTTGKHIGKIVIKIRDQESDRQPLLAIPSAPEMLVTTKTYFNPNKVYIIIGGLGGIGLELIHWMISLGARKFVLTSRNGIKNDYQNFVINRLRQIGQKLKYFEVCIEVLRNDCLTLESAKQVITEATKLGQIGGLFHLGIILNDCLIEKMSFEQFSDSIDCKYKVFDNLDKVTRRLNYPLDYFVLFSSVTCGKGNAGQTNYSFGNSLCERICEQRRREGLHGLAVQYGPVGDVGVFEESSQLLVLSTLQKQRIHSCCEVLDKLLTSNQPIITSWVKAEIARQGGTRQGKMLGELWKAMGIDPQITPDELTLGEIGLESMFAIELQQQLEREFNIKMNINHIKTITVGLLKDYEKGNTEYIKAYIDEMKKAREHIACYNFTMPTVQYTKLNNVINGKPIYFLPPMEITFSAYEELAKKFDRPVIGLNWTRDMSGLQTMKDINQYFTDLLKKLEPKGDYELVGLLDGAIVISKQLLKGRVNKAVIIDVLDEKYLNYKNISEEIIIDLLFQFISTEIPEIFRQKMYRGIFAETDSSNRMKKLVEEIKDFAGRGLIATDMEEMFKIIIKRVKILLDYRNQKKSKFANKLKETIAKKWAKKSGKVHLIKAFRFDKVDDVEKEGNKVRNTYLLPDIEDSKETVFVEAVDHYNQWAVASDEIGDKVIAVFKNK